MQGNTGQGVVLLGERTYFDCRSEAWTPWNYAFLQEKIVQKGYLYFTRLVAIYLIGMLIMGLNITCVHYIDYIIQFTISPIHFHTCPTWILATDWSWNWLMVGWQDEFRRLPKWLQLSMLFYKPKIWCRRHRACSKSQTNFVSNTTQILRLN